MKKLSKSMKPSKLERLRGIRVSKKVLILNKILKRKSGETVMKRQKRKFRNLNEDELFIFSLISFLNQIFIGIKFFMLWLGQSCYRLRGLEKD